MLMFFRTVIGRNKTTMGYFLELRNRRASKCSVTYAWSQCELYGRIKRTMSLATSRSLLAVMVSDGSQSQHCIDLS